MADAEDAVIARLRVAAGLGAAADAPRIGIGDDAAVLRDRTVWTVDTLVEGVHWDGRLSPADVGYKTLAVSVSDLAAMGARPRHALLSLALPTDDPVWVDGFATGLAEACRRWRVHLIGGDTVSTPGPRTVSLTLGGRLVGAPVTRAGAVDGDVLWVTGVPGLASLGWRLTDPPEAALALLRRPDPPVAFALAAARAGLLHAALDLSDGLERDLPRLCRASGVGATIDVHSLELHPALAGDGWRHAVGGGDDYQLLFAADPRHADTLRHLADRHDTVLRPIGRVHADPSVRLSDRDWPGATFEHFPAAGG